MSNSSAIKRLEALFQDVKLDSKKHQDVLVEVETKHSAKCDVHKNTRRGSLGSTLHLTNRRDSLGNVVSQKRDWHHPGYFGNVGPRRESMPALNNQSLYRRRESFGIPLNPPKKELEHPSQFNSTLRGDISSFANNKNNNNNNNNRWSEKRNSLGGSMSSLNGKNYLQVPGINMRRNSRNYSTDSLDGKRNSWDPGRRGSSGSSCGWEEPIWEDTKVLLDFKKQITLEVVVRYYKNILNYFNILNFKTETFVFFLKIYLFLFTTYETDLRKNQ